MKKISGFLFVSLMVFAFTIPVFGGVSSQIGFPSGPHFNLNIHGKSAGFNCPPANFLVTVDANADGDLGTIVQYCDVGDTCVQVYGNSIFIPEIAADANKIGVYMESGRKGPKTAPTTAELQVTDWCGGFVEGDNEVTFRLPANEAGYDVYARILAKPTDNPSMIFTDPELIYAEDEDGFLLWVGTITGTGFTTSTGFTFTRSKGKSPSQNITTLFQWGGDVCYSVPADGRTATPFCQNYGTNPPTYYYDAGTGCGSDTPITLWCSSYSPDWVFNIADFVEMFYSISNYGSKLVQVRFYPR